MRKLTVYIFLGALLYITGCAPSTFNQRYADDNITSKEQSDDSEFIDDVPQTKSDEQLVAYDKKGGVLRFINKNKKENSTAHGLTFQDKLVEYLGTKYRFGGNNKYTSIDCSAFTKTVYEELFNIKLPRTAAQQYEFSERISKDELKPGDLVFFNTRRGVRVGHVGIYIGNNEFVHASSSKGVIKSSLDEDYYTRTYIGAGRIQMNESFKQ
jgi:lipoprotein Spr